MREQKWLVSILFLWWLQPCGSQGHKGVKELSPLIVNSSLEPSSPWSTLNDCLSPTLQPARNLIDVANTIISEHAEMRCIFCHAFPRISSGLSSNQGLFDQPFSLSLLQAPRRQPCSANHTQWCVVLCRWKHHYLQTRLVRCPHSGLWTCV